jgi:hypothetical protein
VTQVFDICDVERNQVLPYDGSDDAILNFDGKVLFTHELLEDFLFHAAEGRISFSGYWQAYVKGMSSWLSDSASEFASRALVCMTRPVMTTIFLDGVFDFITLEDMDCKDAFTCECGKQVMNDNKLCTIYDNGCNQLRTTLLRYPALTAHIQFQIDAMHANGHKNCSPLFNHKGQVSLKDINAAINEQKNRLLRHTQTSVSFLQQIKGLVYMRCVPCQPKQTWFLTV